MNVDRRLEKMHELLERSRPCKITVTFADGTTAITDPAGAIDLIHSMGPSGAIAGMEADRADYAGWAKMLSIVCHPVPNRRISDYE